MKIDRGTAAGLPYAALGSGRPIVVFAGVWPATGVGSTAFVRDTLAPVKGAENARRLYVLNRRPGLRPDMTLRAMADEYAVFLRERFDGPVDVIGDSTGGSIAQIVAAEHPMTVRRLVLLSSGCRLGPHGRRVQARVAASLRAGHPRRAMAEFAAGFVPSWFASAARWGGHLATPWILHNTVDASDLATTLEAEDGFDLATLPRITAPTLIVGGTRDVFYSPEIFSETAEKIPGSSLLLTRHGHSAATTNRRARTAIARFLS